MKAVIFTHVLYLTLIKTFMVKECESKCESKVELRAVLLSCPPKDSGCDDDDPLSQAMRSEESQILHADSKNFDSLMEEKQRGFPNTVKECKRKLVITLKVKNAGKIPCDDEYIVVDHVFDPLTGRRGRLLSPVVVKLRQEQMLQVYGLQFQRVVNSDPFEEQKAGDKTCSVGPDNPTCGIAMYDGKPIPFSEGFCCSCDPHVNAKRQLSPVSRGDSLLYRDSKLISQGNGHVLREDKPGAIVNPELVQLKSGDAEEATGEKKGVDCSGLGDPLCWDKVPNYLLEQDRKIVCDRGDFVGELCKLRQGKMEAESALETGGGDLSSTSTVKSEAAMAGKRKPANLDAGSRKDDPPSDGYANDAADLQNFMKTLNADRAAANSGSPSEGHGPGKGSRGKRENRRESKKLTLEEKLDRFASSKKRLTNRRKRLLELSHRRWRKVEDGCGAGSESPRLPAKGCSAEEYCKTPPRYFFSHDKAIIDPLESSETVNSTSKTEGKTLECEETYRPSSKSEPFKNFKDEKQEKLVDRQFYRRQQKNEDKLVRKDKYAVGKLYGKKEKVTRIEDGRLENGVAKGRETGVENLKEILVAASARDEKRFNPFRCAERKDVEEEGVRTKEGQGETGSSSEQNYGPRSGKSFFRKGEGEKKFAKPRIRNFFTSKNREKQKLRAEFSKSQKKGELRHKEKTGSGDFENDELRGKKEEDLAKVKEGLRRGGEAEGLNSMEFTTETAEASPEMGWEKQGYGGERKHAKTPLEKKGQEGRFRPLKELDGNVNFNVEIIRNRPGVTRFRQPKFEKNSRFAEDAAAALGMQTNSYSLNGKAQYQKIKPSSFLQYQPSQNMYFFDGGNWYSQDAYVATSENGRYGEAKSRSRLDAMLQNRGQPAYSAFSHRKQNRRYHAPLVDYSADVGRLRQPLLPNRGEGLRESQPRAKRHSETPRKRPDVRPAESEKTRSKRSTAYSFQPALGFYESEFDSQKPNQHVIHALEACLEEETVKKREPDARTTAAGLRFPRPKHENSSAGSNIFSSLQELQSRLGHSAFASNKRQGNGKSASDEQRLIQSYLNAPDYVLEEVQSALKGKGQAEEPAEGAGCEKDACGNEYGQDTAHCMRFGDLWYGLYTIKQPVVSQTMGIELFDKHSLCDGTTQWRDLTKGKMIRVGTFFPKAEDELPTVSLTFMGEQRKKVQSAIDPGNYYLLIPSHVSDPSKVNSYPQFEGGPAEYLLVQSKDISSGGECNMIGTSFEAFARQPDRCAQRRGSCLKRQPVDLWREDMEARIRGKRGKYFVENFGNVPNSPVKTYTNLTGEFLALEYYGEYTSTIEIEVKADSNAVVRKGSNGQIPLVYIDSTHPKKTRIILSVLNIGLTSSYFRPRLGDCPPDLDPAWCPLEGPLVTIPPQQRHDFKLDLSGSLPSGQIYLAVQVLNQLNKQIAFRKIIIKRGDRCVCAFHCKCSCIGNLLKGRTCRRLSLEDYRKAGYIGPFPFRGGAAASGPESILGNIHAVFLTAVYLLFFLGVVKGILGICIRRIGIAGTRIITGPKELCCYYEPELLGCSVLYDECGFPVHPTTCQPVQIVPLTICVDVEGCCCQIEESDRKCSRPLLSKQSTCVHYNLTTVVSKKSKQEYLPFPAYKGDDDPLEEDDTEFVLQEMKRYRKK